MTLSHAQLEIFIHIQKNVNIMLMNKSDDGHYEFGNLDLIAMVSSTFEFIYFSRNDIYVRI